MLRHPVEKLTRNQSQGGRLAAALLYYFPSWIQHSSGLIKPTLAARGFVSRPRILPTRRGTILSFVSCRRVEPISPNGARCPPLPIEFPVPPRRGPQRRVGPAPPRRVPPCR